MPGDDGTGEDGRWEADHRPQPATGSIAKVQSILGAVIAAFAAVLSFIGIRAGEIPVILRNQEPVIGFVSFTFLLSIMAAVFAILEPRPRKGKWPNNGLVVATFLFAGSVSASLTGFIPVPLVTTGANIDLGWVLAGVTIAGAVVVLVLSARSVTIEETGSRLPRLRDRLPRLQQWLRGDFDRQRYFVLASILALATAAYAGLRIESVSQAIPFAQLTARVTVTGSGSAVLVISAVSAKVPIPDRVNITVRALGRGTNVARMCAGVPPMNPDAFPCSVDPCDYTYCKTLVGWVLPPDAQGNVQETLVLPFSASLYQQLQVGDQICERTRVDGFCVKAAPVGTTLEIQVAAPTSRSARRK